MGQKKKRGGRSDDVKQIIPKWRSLSAVLNSFTECLLIVVMHQEKFKQSRFVYLPWLKTTLTFERTHIFPLTNKKCMKSTIIASFSKMFWIFILSLLGMTPRCFGMRTLLICLSHTVLVFSMSNNGHRATRPRLVSQSRWAHPLSLLYCYFPLVSIQQHLNASIMVFLRFLPIIPHLNLFPIQTEGLQTKPDEFCTNWLGKLVTSGYVNKMTRPYVLKEIPVFLKLGLVGV